jgi:hypothetical protein
VADLLHVALDAHGGLDRWNELQRVDARLSVTGALWYIKETPNVFSSLWLRADTRTERLALWPVQGLGRRTVLEDGQMTLQTDAGELLEVRDLPANGSEGSTLKSAWNDLDAAYFASVSLWSDFTVPFLYTYPGVLTREVQSRSEGGETWRALRATIPDHIRSHAGEQTAYFGDDGLLRRLDYASIQLGGTTCANYASNLVAVDGIVVPTQRRIWTYDDRGAKISDPLLVSVDVLEVTFS